MPERGPVGHGRTTQLRARRLDRRRGTGKAHVQHALRVGGRRQRQRLATPLVHLVDRLVCRELERARRLGLGQRQALERNLGDHAERAHRTGHQACDVEARDVLHHPTAEREVVAAPVDDADPQHEVARRPGIRATRTRQARGDRAAERRAGAETRRLEGEHLPCRRHRRIDLVERRARPRGDDELRRLVLDDAGVGPRVERLAARRLAEERLGAPAANRERSARRGGRADARLPGGEDRVAHRCMSFARAAVRDAPGPAACRGRCDAARRPR